MARRPILACWRLPLGVALWLVLACAAATHVRWTPTQGAGDWHDAANWDPPQVPSSEDVVVIESDGTYSVVLSQAARVASLYIGSMGYGLQTLLVGANITLEGPTLVGSRGRIVVGSPNGTCGGAPAFEARLRSLSRRDVLSDGEVALASARWAASLRSRGHVSLSSSSCGHLSEIVGRSVVTASSGSLAWDAGDLSLGDGVSIRVLRGASMRISAAARLEKGSSSAAVDIAGVAEIALGSEASWLSLGPRVHVGGLLNVTRGAVAFEGGLVVPPGGLAGGHTARFLGGESVIDGALLFPDVDVRAASFVNLRSPSAAFDSLLVAEAARMLVDAGALSVARFLRVQDAGSLLNVTAAALSRAGSLDVVGGAVALGGPLDVAGAANLASGSISSTVSPAVRMFGAVTMASLGECLLRGVRLTLQSGASGVVAGGGAVRIEGGALLDVGAGALMRAGVASGLPVLFVADASSAAVRVGGSLEVAGPLVTIDAPLSCPGRVVFGPSSRSLLLRSVGLSGDYAVASSAVVESRGALDVRAADAGVFSGIDAGGTLVVTSGTFGAGGVLLFRQVSLSGQSFATFDAVALFRSDARLALDGSAVAKIAGSPSLLAADVSGDAVCEFSGPGPAALSLLRIGGAASGVVRAAMGVGTLVLEGGQLRGALGRLSVGGGNWTGGEISGDGAFQVGGTLSVRTGASLRELRNACMAVGGVLAVNDADIALTDAACLHVLGGGVLRLLGRSAVRAGAGVLGNVTVDAGGEVDVVASASAADRRRIAPLPVPTTPIASYVDVVFVTQGAVAVPSGCALFATRATIAGGRVDVGGLFNVTSMDWSGGLLAGQGSVVASSSLRMWGTSLALASVLSVGDAAVAQALNGSLLTLAGAGSLALSGRLSATGAFSLVSESDASNSTSRLSVLRGGAFLCTDGCAMVARSANMLNNGTFSVSLGASISSDGVLRHAGGALVLAGSASLAAGLVVEGGLFHAGAGARVVGPVSVLGGTVLLASNGVLDALPASVHGDGRGPAFARAPGGFSVEGSYLQRTPAVLSVAVTQLSAGEDGLPPVALSRLSVAGLGVIGGFVSFSFIGGAVPVLDTRYTLAQFAGGVYGDVSVLPGQLLPKPLPARIGDGVDARIVVSSAENTLSLTFFRACPRNCSGNGTCNIATGECLCRTGFQGSDCSVAPIVSPAGCNVHGCGGHGVCDSVTGRCTCDAGYRGDYCSWNAIFLGIGLGLGVLFVLLFGAFMFAVLAHRKQREEKNAAAVLQIDAEAHGAGVAVAVNTTSVAQQSTRSAWGDTQTSVQGAGVSAFRPISPPLSPPMGASRVGVPQHTEGEPLWFPDEPPPEQQRTDAWRVQRDLALETGYDVPSLFGSVGDGDETDVSVADSRTSAPKTRRKAGAPRPPRERKAPALKARMPPPIVVAPADRAATGSRRSSSSSEVSSTASSHSVGSAAGGLAPPSADARAVAQASDAEYEVAQLGGRSTPHELVPVLMLRVDNGPEAFSENPQMPGMAVDV